MYGYIVPDKPNMLMKEYALYRAYYCGVCKATGKLFGQLPRFATNYDIAFFSAFCHDFTAFVPTIKQQACVLNPFKKKDIIMSSPLLERVCCANIILFYYKLNDDIIDGTKGFRRIAKLSVKRAYKKAQKTMPELDREIDTLYKRLRCLEEARETSIDKISDCSSLLLERTACAVLGDINSEVKSLFYNLGKWVYLADALDDLEEDFKKKRFNPLLNSYPVQHSGEGLKKHFINTHRESVEGILFGALNSMTAAIDSIPKSHSSGLIDNIIFRGLTQKTKALLESNKKLRPAKI